MFFSQKSSQESQKASENSATSMSTTYSGTATRIGERPYQEDRVLLNNANELDDFLDLEESLQKQLINTTVASMQEKHGQHQHIGTTLCSVIARKKGNLIELSTTNLGDSRAFYIALNTRTKRLQMGQLTRDHTPTNEETRREEFKLSKGCLISEDTEYRLSMTRSLGDKNYETSGLRHEPEVSFTQIRLTSKDVKTFILVASDGANYMSIPLSMSRYCNSNYEENLSEIFSDEAEKSWKEMRTQRGLDPKDAKVDNISVAVFEITEKAQSALVLDGHGSDSVSAAVSEDYYKELELQINAAFFLAFQQKIINDTADNIPSSSGISTPSSLYPPKKRKTYETEGNEKAFFPASKKN